MADWDKMPVVAVGGPTASGKTAFSVQLAKRLGGEVVCADSMQIYKRLDVGTAKATREEMQGVPHHLMDFLPPEETFSVADFVEAANREVQAICARGRLPILVGGTGLYIESFLNGVRFAEQKADPALREKLEREAAALGPQAMHQKLAEVDPDYAATVHPNNVGRVVRALELYYSTGKTMSGRSLCQKRRRSIRWCSALRLRTARSSTGASTPGWTACWKRDFWKKQSWCSRTAGATARRPRPSATRSFFLILKERRTLPPARTNSSRPAATTPSAS